MGGYGKYAPYAGVSLVWPQTPALVTSKGSVAPYASPGALQDTGLRTCTYFLQGQCKKGAACQFLHPGSEGMEFAAVKTKLCKFFLEGTCKKGEGCNFAHSEEDLQNEASLSEPPLLR